MNLNLIPDRFFSETKPELLKCQKCNSGDIEFKTGGNTPSACDYLLCKQCKTKVCGYGKQRLVQAWNDFQRTKIRA